MKTDKINLVIKKILGNRAKILLTKILFPFRNKFILYNISNRAVKKYINLNYWSETNNLGDTLSPIVVEYMLKQKGLTFNTNRPGKQHLYAIGSILTAGIQDCTVWGSGIVSANLLYRVKNRNLDIRAVRGPLTRSLLLDLGYRVPAIYGDPAIVMPEIYFPNSIKKEYRYGIILHKDDKIEDLKISNGVDYTFLNICTDGFREFVNTLLSVQIVISSSLHGIILAESYGIPAIWIKPKKDYTFKYMDWYYSTGRVVFPMCETIEEALSSIPPVLPKLNDMRSKLKNSFPYDIFQ